MWMFGTVVIYLTLHCLWLQRFGPWFCSSIHLHGWCLMARSWRCFSIFGIEGVLRRVRGWLGCSTALRYVVLLDKWNCKSLLSFEGIIIWREAWEWLFFWFVYDTWMLVWCPLYLIWLRQFTNWVSIFLSLVNLANVVSMDAFLWSLLWWCDPGYEDKFLNIRMMKWENLVFLFF